MAYSFNGTNQHITAPASVTSRPYTFAGWGKATNVNVNTGLIGISNNTVNGTFTILGFSGAAGRFVRAIELSAGVPGIAVTTAQYSANVYAHGASVFASNVLRTAYINGGSFANDVTNMSASSGINQTMIGSDGASPVGSFFPGDIAEVAIWSTALSVGEISSLAKGFKPSRIRPQSLVFYAPLLRNLNDVRGGLALTNNNGATVANHPRVY